MPARRALDPALYFILAAFLIPAWPLLSWLNQRFFEQDSFYSHGWLILPAIAILEWERMGRVRPAPRQVSPAGFGIFLLGTLIFVASTLAGTRFPAAWGLILAAGGAVASLEGFPRLRPYLPPLALLLLMIPLPGTWLLALTSHLRELSARLAVAAANLLGIQAALDGVEVVIPRAPAGPALTIGAPCSGLRSLLVFTAVGLFFCLLSRIPVRRRIWLPAVAVLLAPLSNLLRVLGLILLRRLFGAGAVEGWPHTFLGLGVFGFAFLTFLHFQRKLTR